MRKNINSGITLIALVITITILLVLAGVSIVSLTGDNGLIKRAGAAKEATEKAQEEEILQEASIKVIGKSQTGDVEKDLLELELDQYTQIDSIGEDANGNGIIVAFKSGRTYLVDKEGNVSKK